MLRFVFGRSGYGKTEYVFSKVKELVDSGEKDILIITPEQYSLVSERRLLDELGEAKSQLAQNTSLSRIYDEVKSAYGSNSLKTLSKGGKVILMSRAIDLCKGDFQLFNSRLDSLNFVNSVISVIDEMKSCNLTAEQIRELSENIDNDTLKRKLGDISLIFSTYNALIKDKFNDSADELTLLYDKIKDKNYFKDKYVFLDGFNGFVAQEYKILELIIKEAKCAVITLCTDTYGGAQSDLDLFTYVNKTAAILERIAVKAGVGTDVVTLDENYRIKNSELLAVEKSLFKSTEIIAERNEHVKLYCAKTIADECENACRQIRTLLRSGVKAADITVISRDVNAYRSELEYNFKKYEIPYYNDERQPVNTQPLVVMIIFLLRAVNFSFRSDDILSLAKTGLTDLNISDINDLENYAYVWNINGLKWTQDFTDAPDGIKPQLSRDDKIRLEKINNTRKALIDPLVRFKQRVKNADAAHISAAIYDALIELKADDMVRKRAVSLNSQGFVQLAAEQGRIWELVMDVLNQMATALGEITLRDYAKMFSLVIMSEDLGVIPSCIDNVQFGQADRIRCDNPCAVFVLGANEGEFPQSVSVGGLFSESERRIMLDNDFKLYSYSEILNYQERYFAYMACSCASEYLCVSYIGGGRNDAPSEIVTDIAAKYSSPVVMNSSSIGGIDLVETEQNAFELMSENYFAVSEFYSSLKEYFKNDGRYNTVKLLAQNEPITIKDKEIATRLFGRDMYISASRIEEYYNCPFRYFCKFGLAAKKREKAEINPMRRGTVIHYVLEMILSQVGSKNLSALEYADIRRLVDKYVKKYFDEELGGAFDNDEQFKYNFTRLSSLIYDVVYHLACEFRECDFEAKAFELPIDKDGMVKPEVLSLASGGTVQIRGSIDRVDTFDKNGERYVRVIDYKSGAKKFKLTDILDGLNLQMFVYLFSLCEDKTAELTGLPAGVLYMHAARDTVALDSSRQLESELEEKKKGIFKMNGLVLGDDAGEIPNAMEHGVNGRYIPVTVKKNGDLTGSLASLEELGFIHKKVNQLIVDMCDNLQNGRIDSAPVKNSRHAQTCDFCDYSDVCSNRKFIEERVTDDLTDKEVISALYKEFKENATVDAATE